MIQIGALSKQTGVHIETIRYYERIGIMPDPLRKEGGHRIYDQPLVKRLSFIARSRKLGFSLGEIRGLLSLVDEHEFTCAQVRTMTLDHAAEITRKITDLKKLERVLRDMAAKCSRDGVTDGETDEVPECPIVETLFGDA